MTEHFNILNGFIGNGNPRGRFWFIGLEEAYEWGVDREQDHEELDKYRQHRIRFVKPSEGEVFGGIESEESKVQAHNKKLKTGEKRKKFTRIYDIMSELVMRVHGERLEGVKFYRNTKLLTETGDTFQLNLYPIGKPSLRAWNKRNYSALFEFETPQAYYKYVCEPPNGAFDRFAMLYEEWGKPPHHITVCFGKKGWDDFKKLLKISSSPIKANKWYQIYDSGIIFCPFFFGPQMGKDRIASLACEIQRLLSM